MTPSIAVLTRPLPLPAIPVGQGELQYRTYEGDPAVFDGAQVLISTAVDPVRAELIAQMPDSVRLIANIGVGFDNIDLEAAKARGIAVTNTPVVTEDTADLTFTLLLAACRQLSVNERFLRAGQWSTTQPMAAMGTRVHGQTLGIIGFGEIGQAVARRARGFNMTVLYHGPRAKAEAAEAVGAEYCADLDQLLAQSDIVSLHCPLTEQTRGLMDSAALAKMKAGAVLINTGRGDLVEDAALIDALRSGHLAAAGLDVFQGEPDFHPDYLTLNNVTLTPHIGSATAACRQQMGATALANVIAFYQGQPLPSRVA